MVLDLRAQRIEEKVTQAELVDIFSQDWSMIIESKEHPNATKVWDPIF